MFLNRLSLAEYQQLVQNAATLCKKGTQPGILLTAGQLVVKHTYKRGLWSSSTLWPYPKRFKRNSERLLAMGFNAPTVKAIFDFPAGGCYLTVYSYLPGNTLRQLSQQNNWEPLAQLPQFVARLHERGVYFRDIHTANLLYQPNQQFALIDISSVKIQQSPLNLSQRMRNIAHLLRQPECRTALAPFGLPELVNRYLALTPLSARQQAQFWQRLRKRITVL